MATQISRRKTKADSAPAGLVLDAFVLADSSSITPAVSARNILCFFADCLTQIIDDSEGFPLAARYALCCKEKISAIVLDEEIPAHAAIAGVVRSFIIEFDLVQTLLERCSEGAHLAENERIVLETRLYKMFFLRTVVSETLPGSA